MWLQRTLALGGAAGAGLFGAFAHFFAVAFEFAEGVDGLVLGFVVGTGDDLAQEAHGDELDAGDDQGDAGDHQGAVLAHDGDAVGELFVQKVEGVEQAEENAGYADEAEELKRACRVVLQEFDDDEIEKDPECASDAIVALAALAIEVGDGDFGDARAGGSCECRNETVKFAVELDFLDDFALVGFERCAEVVEVYAAQLGHHPVGDAAGKLAHEPVIAAGIAPAADEVEALLDFLEEARDFFGVVLEVAVHRDNDVAASEVEAGFERGGLAEIAAEADDIDAVIVLVNVGKNFERVIAAAIVDENELVGLADGVHDLGDLHVERRDVFLLVEERDHNRVANCGVGSHI